MSDTTQETIEGLTDETTTGACGACGGTWFTPLLDEGDKIVIGIDPAGIPVSVGSLDEDGPVKAEFKLACLDCQEIWEPAVVERTEPTP